MLGESLIHVKSTDLISGKPIDIALERTLETSTFDISISERSSSIPELVES